MPSNGRAHLEALQRRGTLLDEADAILAAAVGKDLSPQKGARVDAILAEVKALDSDIAKLKHKEKLAMASATPIGAPSAPTFRGADGRTIKALGRKDRMPVTDGEGVGLGIGDVIRASLTGNFSEVGTLGKSLSAGLGASGGFLLPSPLSANILDLARAKTVTVQAGAITVPMESGSLTIATVASDPVPGWRTENEGLPASDMNFGAINLTARSCGVLVKCSEELIRYSANASEVIQSSIAAALGLEIDRAALFGTGLSAEPKGLDNYNISEVDVSAALSEAGEGYAALAAALGKLRAANANETGLTLVTSDTLATAMDGLVDTTGQPLAPPRALAGLVDRRLSTTAIPTVAGTPPTTRGFLGDWSQFLIGLSGGVAIEVSREASDSSGSAFKDLQVWIRAYAFVDFACLRPSHFCRIANVEV